MRLALTFILLIVGAALLYPRSKSAEVKRVTASIAPAKAAVAASAVNPVATAPRAPSTPVRSLSEKALAYVEGHREELGIPDYHQFDAQDYVTPLEKTVVLSPKEDGIPILGLRVEVKFNDANEVESVSPTKYPPVLPAVPATSPASVYFLREGSTVPVAAIVTTGRLVMPGGLARVTQEIRRAEDGQLLKRSIARAEPLPR